MTLLVTALALPKEKICFLSNLLFAYELTYIFLGLICLDIIYLGIIYLGISIVFLGISTTYEISFNGLLADSNLYLLIVI